MPDPTIQESFNAITQTGLTPQERQAACDFSQALIRSGDPDAIVLRLFSKLQVDCHVQGLDLVAFLNGFLDCIGDATLRVIRIIEGE